MNNQPDWLEDFEIPDHFFRDLAEAWYQVISPDITVADAGDLIKQMSLVCLEDAASLRQWHGMEF